MTVVPDFDATDMPYRRNVPETTGKSRTQTGTSPLHPAVVRLVCCPATVRSAAGLLLRLATEEGSKTGTCSCCGGPQTGLRCRGGGHICLVNAGGLFDSQHPKRALAVPDILAVPAHVHGRSGPFAACGHRLRDLLTGQHRLVRRNGKGLRSHDFARGFILELQGDHDVLRCLGLDGLALGRGGRAAHEECFHRYALRVGEGLAVGCTFAPEGEGGCRCL